MFAAAAPVADPNGRVTGHFGKTEIDLPVLHEHAPFMLVRSDDGSDVPGVEIALPGSIVSIEVRTPDGTHQFGTHADTSTFPVRLSGTVNDTEFEFEVTCPSDMAG